MNPLGVGIDLVYIPRIKRLCETYKERFLKRVFTSEELNYALRKRNPFPALASAFAVKEAFFKSLRGYSPFNFQEISLVRDPLTGAPEIHLTGKTEKIFKERGGEKILLSLSHDCEYTIAIVYIWGGK